MNRKNSKVVSDFMAEQAQTIISLERDLYLSKISIEAKDETIKTLRQHVEELRGNLAESRKRFDILAEQIHDVKEDARLTYELINTPSRHFKDDDNNFYWITGEA